MKRRHPVKMSAFSVKQRMRFMASRAAMPGGCSSFINQTVDKNRANSDKVSPSETSNFPIK